MKVLHGQTATSQTWSQLNRRHSYGLNAFITISIAFDVFGYFWLFRHGLTFTSLSFTLYTLLKWSRPSVELLSLADTNVSFVKRRNIELFPAPNSPQRIIFCSGVLVEAIFYTLVARLSLSPSPVAVPNPKAIAQLLLVSITTWNVLLSLLRSVQMICFHQGDPRFCYYWIAITD